MAKKTTRKAASPARKKAAARRTKKVAGPRKAAAKGTKAAAGSTKKATGSKKGAAKGTKKAKTKKAAGTRKTGAKGTKKATARRARTAPKNAADEPLERLRAIIAGFPQTFEKISHGAPTWWGGKKTFATFHVNHHGDGRIGVWLKAPPGLQEALVEADPVRFYRPPYVGPSGWVGVVLEGTVDWDVVAGLLEEGYRQVAPKRALAELDAR